MQPLADLGPLVGEGDDSTVSSPLPRPVSAQAVAAAESAIGYPLPPLLRRIYVELANGQIGPHGGVMGLDGGFWTFGEGIVDRYEERLAAEIEPGEHP
ncbi:hypothetical protein [Dactylosporangium cerinum]